MWRKCCSTKKQPAWSFFNQPEVPPIALNGSFEVGSPCLGFQSLGFLSDSIFERFAGAQTSLEPTIQGVSYGPIFMGPHLL